MVSFDTRYSADSVEFCPFEGNTQYLVCGTYQLMSNENEQMRKGKLYLFEVHPERADQSDKLKLQQCLDLAAVLDIKWCHSLLQGNHVLGVVDSVDGVSFYILNNGKLELSAHQEILQDPSVLCLSLDWSSRRYTNSIASCVVSHSNGCLSLLSQQEHGIAVSKTWQGHNLEAWIAAFNYWEPSQVFSGADDMLFRGWDIRTDLVHPTFTSRKHQMGVTAIQSNPHREHSLATGSYDEHIYLWDVRNIKSPVSTIHTPGGGIWRLKWHPSLPTSLLSASMHAGAFIVDTEQSCITDSFLDHESMVYGADWSYSTRKKNLLASCSFYDHVLHLWESL
ncbi:WD repeat-containing protein 85-like protein [Hesseltinella vesiculosa]|uniref:methylated diphthine methylhydrolase n=1 Tax=Hesseltinella vesiculosa TaxID=101127 RepID=A0A1X2G326_9FUNG|nr:WD repeat-containing protein 85-like protein [Hesseltinella vesiculosa]